MRTLIAFSVVLLVTAATSPAVAWNRLFTLNRVEADPDKTYELGEDNGPWMVMACSFSGDLAADEAHALVLELRSRYKLPAYMYKKTFELNDDDQGRDQPVRYQQDEHVTEYAVLVGNFSSIDDPQAQETLRKIKYFRPDCLELSPDRKTTRNLAALRYIQKSLLSTDNEKKTKGPMGHAFLTTNPLLPKEYFRPNGVDQFVVKLNEGLEYSLLNCSGKYTVMVARFTGEVVYDQQRIAAIEKGEAETQGTLAEAARNAHELTIALREKNYEAYEFHDRHSSIVTIGSFDRVGTELPNGQIELDPRIHRIMQAFAAEPGPSAPGSPAVGFVPKRLLGIPFAIQPLPVEVPKRSIAADYAR